VVVAENFEAAAERGGAGLRPADAENLAPAHCGLVIVGDCRSGHISQSHDDPCERFDQARGGRSL
jgi:hypothetical protein